MRTLHILNKPPGHPRFQRCLAALDEQDQLLLTESAVLAMTDPGDLPWQRTSALVADVEARALSRAAKDRVTLVSYDEMVRLTVESERTISW